MRLLPEVRRGDDRGKQCHMELNNLILFFAGKEPTRNTISSATTWGYRIEANDRMIRSNFFLYPSPALHSPETIETDEYSLLNLDALSQGGELEYG